MQRLSPEFLSQRLGGASNYGAERDGATELNQATVEPIGSGILKW
jgi:hypothetical protein